MSAGYVETNDQRIKYFKKLIKFRSKDDNNALSNEISFVPHLGETTDVIERTTTTRPGSRNKDDELTTVIIDTGSKFAYDTINNNGESVFASNNATDLEGDDKSNKRPKITTPANEVVESSAAAIENNGRQGEAAFDVVTTRIESQSNEHIGNKTAADVDTKANSKGNRKISAKSENSKNEISANGTSTEKSPNDFEIKRFISEHIKYKSNNVTIKKSWGKWGPWSSCSRSCGEGVTQQSRECMEKM